MVSGGTTQETFIGLSSRVGDQRGNPMRGVESLEGTAHANIYSWIGKDPYTFVDMGARDPVFYAHHSNIDRMFQMERARREMQRAMDGMREQEEHEALLRNATVVCLNPLEICHGGSSFGRVANIDRDRLAGHQRIMQDYFIEHSTYTDAQFRRRFRMRRALFLRIVASVQEQDHYFVQKNDAVGMQGLSSIQKVTAAIRMLAYGQAADSLDKYVRIGETTAIECLKRFCIAVVNAFKSEYLRAPIVEDTERILRQNANRGFPGMIGSIDCMHWPWKNCPRGWAGQYQGKLGHPTIVLEAVASYDLWIWHAFFGMLGSCNDLNVLSKSHVFRDQMHGVAPKASFEINGHRYVQTYMLTDGIYSQWATFVKSIKDPQGEKRKHFAQMQESIRKDVERAFGVLQARWSIVRQPAQLWDHDTLRFIMSTCIILHNMIVEDERELHGLERFQDGPLVNVERGRAVRDTRLPSILLSMGLMRDEQRHLELRNDLIEHLWSIKGNE